MNRARTPTSTCDALAHCQRRKPACGGCPESAAKEFPFAPGTIETGYRKAGTWRAFAAWVLAGLLAIGASGAVVVCIVELRKVGS